VLYPLWYSKKVHTGAAYFDPVSSSQKKGKGYSGRQPNTY